MKIITFFLRNNNVTNTTCGFKCISYSAKRQHLLVKLKSVLCKWVKGLKIQALYKSFALKKKEEAKLEANTNIQRIERNGFIKQATFCKSYRTHSSNVKNENFKSPNQRESLYLRSLERATCVRFELLNLQNHQWGYKPQNGHFDQYWKIVPCVRESENKTKTYGYQITKETSG